MQRIVGSYVGSAFGAGQFYSKAVSEAKDATARLANDDRDEDRGGPVGFDSNAQRKREFAADMALQAHALRMAAEGAVSAYENVVGESWKPYERQVENPGQTVSQQAADLQMAALGWHPGAGLRFRPFSYIRPRRLELNGNFSVSSFHGSKTIAPEGRMSLTLRVTR